MAKKKLPKPSEVLPVLLESGSRVSVGDLAEHLINALGGMQEFARMYADELQSPLIKGVAKARMLEGVMRLVTSHSTINKKLDNDEAGLTDAELEEELGGILERVNG